MKIDPRLKENQARKNKNYRLVEKKQKKKSFSGQNNSSDAHDYSIMIERIMHACHRDG